MNNLFTIFIIVALIVFIMYQYRTLDRMGRLGTTPETFKAIKLSKGFGNCNKGINNQYSYFVNPNKNLHNIFNKFNTKIQKYNKSFGNVVNYRLYTDDNFGFPIYYKTKSLIGKVLDVINTSNHMKFKFVNLETIETITNTRGDMRVNAIFFILEVNKFTSRKVLLQYDRNIEGNIKINFIKALQSNEKPRLPGVVSDPRNTNVAQGYTPTCLIDLGKISKGQKNDSLFPKNNSRGKWILTKQMEILKQLCATQEPCKYDLFLWDKNSINKQVKLAPTCNITNHATSIYPLQPFVNPTIYELPRLHPESNYGSLWNRSNFNKKI